MCPACRGENSYPVMTIQAAEAAQHFVLREDNPKQHDAIAEHIRTLWNGPACQIIKCETCNFGFAFPFMAGDATFYNLAFSAEGYPADKWDFRRTIRALDTTNTKGKAALEIAAGNGFFLDKIAGTFFDRSRIVATEYNAGSAKKLVAKGYTTICDDVRAKSFDDKQQAYDFIFLFQVVEHMSEPDQLFERLRMLIRPGGMVFITVPNGARTSFQESSGSLLDMPPNHIGRWTPEAFRAVTSRCGFKMMAYEVEPFNYSKFLKIDIFYSHRRRSQSSGSFANRRVRRLPRGMLRKSSEAVTMALFAPLRIPVWIKAFPKRASLGYFLSGLNWKQHDAVELSE